MSSSFIHPGGRLVRGWRFEETLEISASRKKTALAEAIEDLPDWIDPTILAEMAGICRQSLMNRIARGKIKAIKFLNTEKKRFISQKYLWKIHKSEVERMARDGELDNFRPDLKLRRNG